MKKLMAGAFALAMAANVFADPTPQKSVTVTAEVQFKEDGNRLWCYVALAGGGRGRVSPVIRWTAPDNAPLFASGTYQSPAVRTRTKAYRTLVTTANGKQYRATGTWRVEVEVGGVVIGEGTYEVK
jgi:hypothetical protein